METTWTRCSMCLNVDGFLRNNKFPRGYDIFQNDDGTELRREEALAYLHTEKAKGHKVIPCGEDCGNPCKNADKGCAGFDYSGGGCPGYKVPNAEVWDRPLADGPTRPPGSTAETMEDAQ